MGGRYKGIPQADPNGDILWNNNVGFVQGVYGTPINQASFFGVTPGQAAAFCLDPSGNFWNLFSVLPLSLIPDLSSLYVAVGTAGFSLNKLVTDHQGLLLFDQSGNDYYFQ
jgi:hypothetical protein